MAAPEIGWCSIDSDVGDIAAGPWMQWHSDAVTLPPGAVELARNPFGVQAWRRGRLLCTQFHPEEWDDEHPAGRAIIERFVELAGNSR